ncbi:MULTISPECIES: peptidylprolyl isomerase [Mumia]|uniref:peptidylprolyl isomerase n=1 Tax=Mumia TaxID=1546255 RepID=UPI00244457CD|nr:peptidylprolyl isomerase [Mumia sp. ZJ430]
MRMRWIASMAAVLLLVTGCGGDDEDAGASVSAAQATITTNHGDITVTLFPDEAPETVANFVGLATGDKEWTDPESGDKKDEPLYDDTVFHRVIPGFMIQGGDPLGTGMGGPGYEFEDEIVDSLTFDRPYLLAMANAGPDTNGSQFFITTAETPHLDGLHTIFGEVADDASKAVVDEISAVQTGEMDAPVEPVVIESVVVAD